MLVNVGQRRGQWILDTTGALFMVRIPLLILAMCCVPSLRAQEKLIDQSTVDKIVRAAEVMGQNMERAAKAIEATPGKVAESAKVVEAAYLQGALTFGVVGFCAGLVVFATVTTVRRRP